MSRVRCLDHVNYLSSSGDNADTLIIFGVNSRSAIVITFEQRRRFRSPSRGGSPRCAWLCCVLWNCISEIDVVQLAQRIPILTYATSLQHCVCFTMTNTKAYTTSGSAGKIDSTSDVYQLYTYTSVLWLSFRLHSPTCTSTKAMPPKNSDSTELGDMS